ncbi:MAG: restriction endonuclease subunit S [Muribaculaceae bacterium]|nr:restriction endonuclease subunit S [Muribaculaceae bacterium]
MSEWKCYKLNEISSMSNGINFDKSAYTSGVKLIGVSDFKNRTHPDYDSLQEVDSRVVKNGDYLEKGDIVFVRSNGNKELVGRCMMIDRDIPVTYSGFCIKLRLKDKKRFDPVFFNYLFRTSQFKKSMTGTAVGANIQNLSQSRLGSCEVNVPEIETQREIATILSRYDSLIENYQKQIKLLEEAAQRLYKEWFVDLHFPGHQSTPIIDNLPQSWQKKKLGEIADVNCKSISRDYPFDFVDYIDLGAVREGHIEKPTRYLYGEEPGRAKRVASDGDIIWGMVRPNLKAYALVQNPKRSEVFSTGFSIITARDVPFSFLYCAVTTEAFVGYLVNCTNGAAYPAVKAEHFEKADIIIPSKMVLDNFHQHVGRMYRTIGYLQTQIRLLTEARDRLLPKLMSGEIAV